MGSMRSEIARNLVNCIRNRMLLEIRYEVVEQERGKRGKRGEREGGREEENEPSAVIRHIAHWH